MRVKKIGCRPVAAEGKRVGIPSEYDLLRIIEELPASGTTANL